MSRPRMVVAVIPVIVAMLGGVESAAVAQSLGEDAVVLREFYSANGLLQRELYDLAAQEYRKFLENYGDHDKAPVARYGLGVSLFRLQQFENAATELEQLRNVRRFEYAPQVATILGQCQMNLGRHAVAAEIFDDVLDDFPDHDLADDAAAFQAEAFYRAGDFDAVNEPCRILVERWPDSPRRERAELFRGLSDMARQDFETATDRFGDMLQRYPRGEYADQASLLLAQSLHRSNRLTRAAAEYRKVIDRARAEFLPEAMHGLALLLHSDRELQAAGTLLDRLLSSSPGHALAAPATLLRGRVWFDQGEYGQAANLFQQVAQGDADLKDDAAYWLAKCDLRQGTPDRAAARLATAIKDYSESELKPEMMYDWAVALQRAGALEQADAVFNDFRDEFPSHVHAPDALHAMAAIAHQRTHYEISLARAREFLKKYEDHARAPSIAYLVGENQFLAREYDDAVGAFGTFLDDYPNDPQRDNARFRLGMAYYHLDRVDEARTLLTEIADGAKTSQQFRNALLALGDMSFRSERWSDAEQLLTDFLSYGVDQPSADDALLKLGLSYARTTQPNKALAAFDTLIAEAPESHHLAQAIFERGQALVALGSHDAARQAFETLLDESPEGDFAVHALNHLGALASERGDYAVAATYYGQVASQSDTGDLTGEALFQAGQALVSARQFEQATQRFTRLLDKHQNHRRVPEATALRAVALARNDEHDQALREINRVEQRHASRLHPPLIAAILYEKAWCLRETDHIDDATDAYRQLLDQHGDELLHNHALLELAEIESQAEQYSSAAELLRELQQRADGGAVPQTQLIERGLYRLGVCEFRMDNTAEASRLLEAFISTFENSDLVPSASLMCGEALYRQSDFSRAAAHMQRVVDEYPEDDACAASLLRLGECYAMMQQWDESRQQFELHRQRFSDSEFWFQAQFGIGWALDNTGEHEAAIAAYQPVVDGYQGPTAARAQFQIGECLFAQRKFEEAARQLLRVDILYAYPQWSAAALYEAGRCFLELGSPVQARKHFELVRAQHGDTQWAQLATQRLNDLARTSLPGG